MNPHIGDLDLDPTPPVTGSGEDPALERAALAVAAGIDPEQNFRRLFDCFHRAVERFFSRRGVGTEDCLDLTQETFLRIYHGLERYRSEDRLSHWVLRIAATTYLQWMRAGRAAKRAGRETSTDAAELAVPGLSLPSRQLEALLAEEQRLVLRQALDELPEQMRHCLRLRLERELTYQQIATLMRLAPDTVKAHLFQARRRLKEKVGKALGSVLEGDGE